MPPKFSHILPSNLQGDTLFALVNYSINQFKVDLVVKKTPNGNVNYFVLDSKDYFHKSSLAQSKKKSFCF